MDIGKVIEEGERALPGIPTFPSTMPAPVKAPTPAPATPVKTPEREKVPA